MPGLPKSNFFLPPCALVQGLGWINEWRHICLSCAAFQARGLELLVSCCQADAPCKPPRARLRRAPATAASGASAWRAHVGGLQGRAAALERLVLRYTEQDVSERPSEPWRPAAQDPSQDKFRRIRLGNAAFQVRVGGLEGGIAALELLGFAREPADDALVLPADKVRPLPCAAHARQMRHDTVRAAALVAPSKPGPCMRSCALACTWDAAQGGLQLDGCCFMLHVAFVPGVLLRLLGTCAGCWTFCVWLSSCKRTLCCVVHLPTLPVCSMC